MSVPTAIAQTDDFQNADTSRIEAVWHDRQSLNAANQIAGNHTRRRRLNVDLLAAHGEVAWIVRTNFPRRYVVPPPGSGGRAEWQRVEVGLVGGGAGQGSRAAVASLTVPVAALRRARILACLALSASAASMAFLANATFTSRIMASCSCNARILRASRSMVARPPVSSAMALVAHDFGANAV